MLKVYFLELKKGHLTRLHYFGYVLLLNFIASLTVALAGFVILFPMLNFSDSSMPFAPFTYTELEGIIEESMTYFSMGLLVVVLFLILAFMGMNIMVKRMRDTGLSGWWTLAIVYFIGYMATAFISIGTSVIIQFSLFSLFLILPTDIFLSAKDKKYKRK